MRTREELLELNASLNSEWNDINDNCSWSDGRSRKLDLLDAKIDTIDWVLNNTAKK